MLQRGANKQKTSRGNPKTRKLDQEWSNNRANFLTRDFSGSDPCGDLAGRQAGAFDLAFDTLCGKDAARFVRMRGRATDGVANGDGVRSECCTSASLIPIRSWWITIAVWSASRSNASGKSSAAHLGRR
jgi:hypothetical protein